MKIRIIFFIYISLVTVHVCGQNNQQSETQNNNEHHTLPYSSIEKFIQVLHNIKQYYVSDISEEELFELAIKGMVDKLDPHSKYLMPEDFTDLMEDTDGNFGGIGVEISIQDNMVKVISPLDGTPAEKAGILPGDYIIKINEKYVEDIGVSDAVAKIRGPKGSTVTLTIAREGERILELDVVRDTIKIQSVVAELFDNKYGYIKINQFQSSSSKDFLDSLSKLKKESSQFSGLIIDLRNNPGGLLTSAVDIADALIHNDQKGEEEVIVYTEGNNPDSKFYSYATPGDIINNAPVVVLINNGSASGSEIVAGALKDNDRAIIVGTKSFGKGSVQSIIPIDHEHALKLTTAVYYTPSGQSIQATGLEPDIEIKASSMTEEETTSGISESSLSNHIEAKNKFTKDEEDAKDKSLILKDDFQLQQAYNILKAMSFSKNKMKAKQL